jgi:hypothetical protein
MIAENHLAENRGELRPRQEAQGGAAICTSVARLRGTLRNNPLFFSVSPSKDGRHKGTMVRRHYSHRNKKVDVFFVSCYVFRKLRSPMRKSFFFAAGRRFGLIGSSIFAGAWARTTIA